MDENLSNILKLNSLGLFPAPGEDECSFMKRANFYLSNPVNNAGLSILSAVPKEAIENSLIFLQNLFDISPFWTPLYYHSKGLRPWEGAATWVGQSSLDEVPTIIVQLRESFAKSTLYLNYYDRDELLSHELVHASKALYPPSIFEELQAYQTAKQPWRRYLGPLLQRSSEAWGLIAVILLSWMVAIWSLIEPPTRFENLVSFLPMIMPAGFLCFAFLRLYFLHRSWRRCLKALKELLPDPNKAPAVGLRLTQEEVLLCARASKKTLLNYIQKQSCMRWKVIRLAYFGHEFSGKLPENS